MNILSMFLIKFNYHILIQLLQRKLKMNTFMINEGGSLV